MRNTSELAGRFFWGRMSQSRGVSICMGWWSDHWRGTGSVHNSVRSYHNWSKCYHEAKSNKNTSTCLQSVQMYSWTIWSYSKKKPSHPSCTIFTPSYRPISTIKSSTTFLTVWLPSPMPFHAYTRSLQTIACICSIAWLKTCFRSSFDGNPAAKLTKSPNP